jgi:hypothetical protein
VPIETDYVDIETGCVEIVPDRAEVVAGLWEASTNNDEENTLPSDLLTVSKAVPTAALANRAV